jgi:hypothetical protein
MAVPYVPHRGSGAQPFHEPRCLRPFPSARVSQSWGTRSLRLVLRRTLGSGESGESGENGGARVGPTVGVDVVGAEGAGAEAVGVGSAGGVGVGWSDGVGVGSDGDGELDGDGETWALATDPDHVASESRSAASVSPIRTVPTPRPGGSLIGLQALSPGITPSERLLNAWRCLSPDADRCGPWRRARDLAP